MVKKIGAYLFLSIVTLFCCIDIRDLWAEFYKYVDENGVLRFVDDPTKIPPQFRKDITIYNEKYDHLPENERLNLIERDRMEFKRKQLEQFTEQQIHESHEATKKTKNDSMEKFQQSEEQETPVIVKENHVLVPATIGYEENEVEVLLLLDTGASIIALHQKTADQMNIKGSKLAIAQVAGGKKIRFKLVRLSYVQVGPHKIEDIQAGIIKYQGPPVDHHGLLGMNFLRNFEYSIDYKNQIIKWKP